MSEGNKSVILPLFSGKDDEFQTWWTKFMAFATAKGVAQALKREAELPATRDEDLDEMEALGMYEVAPEDFALTEFICVSKQPHQDIIRKGLDLMLKEIG